METKASKESTVRGIEKQTRYVLCMTYIFNSCFIITNFIKEMTLNTVSYCNRRDDVRPLSGRLMLLAWVGGLAR